MKKQILSIILIAACSYSALAEKTNTVSATMPSISSNQGLRIALVKPFLNLKGKASDSLGNSGTFTQGLDNEVGLSLGYAYLPVQQMGFTTNATYMNIGVKDDDTGEKEDYGFARIDANIAYTFTDMINVKGGLNISKFTNKEPEDYKAGIGFQFGVGVQATQNFGIDVSLVQMNQSEKFEDAKVKISEQGLELGVHATF